MSTGFVDDEGSKCIRQMILYLAITGHFLRQKRCQSVNEETDGYLYRWSTDGNINIGSVVCNGF